jgi:hypothetical protein
MNNQLNALTTTRVLKMETEETSPDLSIAEYREINKRFFVDHLETRIPELEAGVAYTLRTMCDPSFWNGFYPAARRIPGRHISQLVKNGHLPLVALEKNSSKAQKYMLI